MTNALSMEKPAQSLLEPLKPRAQPLLEALKKNDVNELRALIRKGEQIQEGQLPSLLALPKESWVKSMPVLMTECPIAENIQLVDEGRVKSLLELARDSLFNNKHFVLSCNNKIPRELLVFLLKRANQPEHFKLLGETIKKQGDDANSDISQVSKVLVDNLIIPQALELILCMTGYVSAEQKQLFFGPVKKNISIDWYTCLVSELISRVVNRQVKIRNSYIQEFKAINTQAGPIVDKSTETGLYHSATCIYS